MVVITLPAAGTLVAVANENKTHEIRSVFWYTSLSLAIQNCLFDESKCVVGATTVATNRENLQMQTGTH